MEDRLRGDDVRCSDLPSDPFCLDLMQVTARAQASSFLRFQAPFDLPDIFGRRQGLRVDVAIGE